MASSYPTSLDALVNPTATDNMATVSHSDQHANANDAIEAIQVTLGLSPQGSSASVAARLSALESADDDAVVGPTSAAVNALAVFSNIDGKHVTDCGVTVDSGGNLVASGTVAADGLAGDLLSSATPLSDGTATAGVSSIPARQDHVHPSDSAKMTRLSSTTDNSVVRFDGTTGLIQGSPVTVSDTGSIDGVADINASGTLDVDGIATLSDDVFVGGDLDVTGAAVIDGSVSAASLTVAGLSITASSGSPEGAVTAPVGSLYLRTDGGAGTCLYVKESGSGSSGWVAK